MCLKLLFDNFLALARISLRRCGALKETNSGRGFDAGARVATSGWESILVVWAVGLDAFQDAVKHHFQC